MENYLGTLYMYKNIDYHSHIHFLNIAYMFLERLSAMCTHQDVNVILLTVVGKMGASHMCLPSLVLLTPSISLSGVLTSFCMLANTFTLSGQAAISIDVQGNTMLTNIQQQQKLFYNWYNIFWTLIRMNFYKRKMLHEF